MAATVLNGKGTTFSWTNTTGQNVRVVFNYIGNITSMTIAGLTHANLSTPASVTIGKHLAFAQFETYGYQESVSICYGQFMGNIASSSNFTAAYPTEIALTNGQSFAFTCKSATYSGWHIVVIPES
jgi:hypothetical protein